MCADVQYGISLKKIAPSNIEYEQNSRRFYLINCDLLVNEMCDILARMLDLTFMKESETACNVPESLQHIPKQVSVCKACIGNVKFTDLNFTFIVKEKQAYDVQMSLTL